MIMIEQENQRERKIRNKKMKDGGKNKNGNNLSMEEANKHRTVAHNLLQATLGFCDWNGNLCRVVSRGTSW
jgi:hypothetical protein